jgi:hypothetical protein
MRTRLLPGIAATLVLACSFSALAQDKGTWRTASSTATAITGDIAISDTKIAINFANFTIAQIRKLNPAEVSSVFDVDSATSMNGNLYRLTVPASKRFAHHNTLCGTEDTQWLVTYAEGRILHIAFFSGAAMPLFTRDALANSTDLCGTFTYVR